MTYLLPDSAAHQYGTEGWDIVSVPHQAFNTASGFAPKYWIYGPSPFNVLYHWWFEPTVLDLVSFDLQIPHRYEEGTNIIPCVHWVPSINAGAADRCVVWRLYYSWANPGQSFPALVNMLTDATDDSTQTLQKEQLVAGRHYQSAFAAITGTGKTIGSVLVCRLDRYGTHALDDYTGRAALLSFSVYFRVNSLGSASEYSK
jgi:hypothetical protein